jgi:hypothetical protein
MNDVIGLTLFLLAGISVFIILVAMYASDRKKAAFEKLRQDPTSNKRRESTLTFGIYLAEVARNDKRTMFNDGVFTKEKYETRRDQILSEL